jgi:hypothetical protein
MKYDSVDVAALSLEVLLQQIERPLRVGARQTLRTHVTPANGARHNS